MAGRVFAGLIVGFWLVTMAALVRVEFFPQSVSLDAVPSSKVFAKIFANAEPARLNVFYQGSRIGFCKVEITPLTVPEATEPASQGATPQAYRVHSELTLAMTVFSMPSRLRLVGDSLFDTRYQIKQFQVRTTVGDGHIEIKGDEKSGKVRMLFDVADLRQEREFPFQNMQATGLAGAMGLPGLANFGLLGGSVGAGSAGPARSAGQPHTRMMYDHLEISGTALRTYLIETRLDETVWARIWISELGEVLQVQTSMGLTMLADVLSEDTAAVSGHNRRR